MHHLPQNLKRLRAHNARSQEYVAASIGVKRSSYSGYENGSAEPNIDTLMRMSEYLRLPLDVLLGKEVPLPRSFEMNAFLMQHQKPHA